MKSNQKGFGTVEIIIAVVVVGLIGFGAWRVMQNKDETPAKVTNSSTPAPTNDKKSEKAANSKFSQTYVDNIGNFSLEYPADWKLKEGATSTTDKYANATLTSPTGTVLTLKSNQGGKGGACEPAAGDVAFKAGNACSSLEFLSKEALPINNVYYVARYEAGKNVTSVGTVNLITQHYADPDGTQYYTIGVNLDTPDFTPKIGEKKMGFVVNDPQIVVYNAEGNFLPYTYISATSKDEAFLKSADADTIKDIIRTLRFSI